jgi:hypothetical protein
MQILYVDAVQKLMFNRINQCHMAAASSKSALSPLNLMRTNQPLPSGVSVDQIGLLADVAVDGDDFAGCWQIEL